MPKVLAYQYSGGWGGCYSGNSPCPSTALHLEGSVHLTSFSWILDWKNSGPHVFDNTRAEILTPFTCLSWSLPPLNSVLASYLRITYHGVRKVASVMSLCNPMDCSPPGSSVHGISQARILEWVALSYCRESSSLRDQTHVSCVSCIGKQVLYH